MFDVSFGELVVIAIVVLLVAGPQRLPEMFRTGGRYLRDFRRVTRDLQSKIGIDEMLREDEPEGLPRVEAREYPPEGPDARTPPGAGGP